MTPCQSRDATLELGLKQRQREDKVIRRWLTFPPHSLTEMKVWTKAFAGRANGERMAVCTRTHDKDSDTAAKWNVTNFPESNEELCGSTFD